MHPIEVTNLCKTFGEVQALRDLSFSVEQGEVFGLLGPNGAGKSTAINILLGLTKPTGGTVKVFGKDPMADRNAVLPRINFSAAYATLPFNLKAVEALTIYGRLYSVRNLSEKIRYLIDLFEIPAQGQRVIGGMSSGEQTRLNLAKSLINDPDILLLDEPTANLDPNIAEKVRGIVRAIQAQRKITILYTSHNMREVESLCQRVLFLHRGKAVTEGPPKAVMERFGHTNLEEVFIDIARGGEVLDTGEEK